MDKLYELLSIIATWSSPTHSFFISEKMHGKLRPQEHVCLADSASRLLHQDPDSRVHGVTWALWQTVLQLTARFLFAAAESIQGMLRYKRKKCSDWSKTAIKDTRQLSALTTDTNTLIMLCLQRHKHVSLMITAFTDQITAQSQQTN